MCAILSIFGLSRRGGFDTVREEMQESDFLVIGSGAAGLSFALRAAEFGSVIVLTKGKALDSNSARAQGGIAAVMDISDSYQSHISDTLIAGAGLCDKEAVRVIVEGAPSAIADLRQWGVCFDLSEDQYELGREGGHSCRRILHSKDSTGLEISGKLLEAVVSNPRIHLYEYHYVIDLITSAKLGVVTEDRVLGAYVLNSKTGEVDIFRSDRVLLATGGSGKVYLYSTNPEGSTGDGVAMAWRAGATISNMEFIQFHPTCFYNPRAEGAAARSFLISEAVRGEGGILVGADGQEFMSHYDERGSLAPRDIVARAIDKELKRTGQPCVYVDISHKPVGFVRKRFPLIYETCLEYGIDAETMPIPVVPAAHYQCGGVATDINGKTDLRGLYASGEVGCTGLHGANRLASNSLLECIVISKRALADMLNRHPLNKASGVYPIAEWHYGDTTTPDELAIIYHNWDEIRTAMWDYVSIVRTNKRLQRAATRLRNLQHEVKDFYWGYCVTPEILELRNLVVVASLIVDCAIRRSESRGLHCTMDFPESSAESSALPTYMRRS